MTRCTQPTLPFEAFRRREIVARFDRETISSDGGALLFAEVEQRTRIVERFTSCFVDRRERISRVGSCHPDAEESLR